MDDETLRTVANLRDRQEILDCIYRYCRAVDRFDRDLLMTVYHEDAVDDHGIFVGGREGFADYFFPLLGEMHESSHHTVTNHTCELDGDVAHCESYWMMIANNRQEPPVMMTGGRYIDRFERRSGHWAITARKCVIEWDATPNGMGMTSEMRDPFDAVGHVSRDNSDLSYDRPLAVSPSRLGYHLNRHQSSGS